MKLHLSSHLETILKCSSFSLLNVHCTKSHWNLSLRRLKTFYLKRSLFFFNVIQFWLHSEYAQCTAQFSDCMIYLVKSKVSVDCQCNEPNWASQSEWDKENWLRKHNLKIVCSESATTRFCKYENSRHFNGKTCVGNFLFSFHANVAYDKETKYLTLSSKQNVIRNRKAQSVDDWWKWQSAVLMSSNLSTD